MEVTGSTDNTPATTDATKWMTGPQLQEAAAYVGLSCTAEAVRQYMDELAEERQKEIYTEAGSIVGTQAALPTKLTKIDCGQFVSLLIRKLGQDTAAFFQRAHKKWNWWYAYAKKDCAHIIVDKPDYAVVPTKIMIGLLAQFAQFDRTGGGSVKAKALEAAMVDWGYEATNGEAQKLINIMLGHKEKERKKEDEEETKDVENDRKDIVSPRLPGKVLDFEAFYKYLIPTIHQVQSGKQQNPILTNEDSIIDGPRNSGRHIKSPREQREAKNSQRQDNFPGEAAFHGDARDLDEVPELEKNFFLKAHDLFSLSLGGKHHADSTRVTYSLGDDDNGERAESDGPEDRGDGSEDSYSRTDGTVLYP